MKLTKKDNIKNYLLFRNEIEMSIDALKSEVKNNLKQYKDELSKLSNVSIQKIEFYITLFKKNFKSIEITTNEIFETLISQFDYNQSSEHYRLNEIIIKDYIKESLELQIRLQNYRKLKRKEIKEYRELNKGLINFNAAENSFVEMRRTLKQIELDENYINELTECREVADSLIKEIKNNSNMNSNLIKTQKQSKPKRIKFSEKDILNILMGSKEIQEQIKRL